MLKTPLHDWHVAHGGRMVDFAGWAMPVQYSTITEEHQAVRTAAGLFDISHMGRLYLTGPDAVLLAERFVTCRVATMEPWQVRYGLVTNESGGVLDDVLVYRLPVRGVWVVVNACNREKIVEWIDRHRGHRDTDLADTTLQSAMIAVQGPAAAGVLWPHVEGVPERPKYYRFCTAKVFGFPLLLSRTGYTGEDGYELIVGAAQATAVWERLLEVGEDAGLLPCGLGCRDTLRLEAGMPLYGHELTEEIDPISAGLSFAVSLDKEFVGRDAIAKAAERTPEKVRVGLRLAGKRIAREGTPLLAGEESVGVVTSGTFSPTLQASIAMGYVAARHAEPGARLEGDLRGKREEATVVPLPFYRRKK